ncbi:MAG: DUF4384 domain-containing protein [Planctomycetia bacterium]|nr:DUF4384 domain-containing protein [Planctomycetia bacterium]
MTTEFLARRFKQEYHRGGLLQKIFGSQREIEASIGAFLATPDTTSFLCSVGFDENESKYTLDSCQAVSKVSDITAIDDSTYLIQVQTGPFELQMSWTLKDQADVPFALTIKATCVIGWTQNHSAHVFLDANLRRFQVYDEIVPLTLEQRLQPEALTRLTPMFVQYTYDLISEQNAVCPDWIAGQLNECLQSCGVVVNDVTVAYNSDTANAKREEEELAAARMQEENALRETLEHDLNLRTIRSDYEQAEQRRKHKATLDSYERLMEEEAARDKVRRQRILAKKERDSLKSQRKYERLEAELRISELREKPRAYREELQSELEVAREELKNTNKAFQELQDQVQQLSANLPQILRQITENQLPVNDQVHTTVNQFTVNDTVQPTDGQFTVNDAVQPTDEQFIVNDAVQPTDNPFTVNDAVQSTDVQFTANDSDQLIFNEAVAFVHVMGVDAQTLAEEGATKSKEFVSATLAQRAQSKTLPTITTRFASLVPRDICPGLKENTVRVGKPISFDFVSPVAGYLTIVNLGTSGRYFLHSPNYFIEPGNAKVPAQTNCEIPGKLLSPNGQISQEDYNELGPVGFEEVYVIVTPQPLVSAQELQELSYDSPCAELSLERMLQMIEALGELPADKCAVGAVSFFVVND